jgi:hypothetical protein
MTKISLYPTLSNPTEDDILIGTDVNNSDETKNFSISSIITLALTMPNLIDIPSYEDNADAITGGLVNGDVYRTDDLLKIVHS